MPLNFGLIPENAIIFCMNSHFWVDPIGPEIVWNLQKALVLEKKQINCLLKEKCYKNLKAYDALLMGQAGFLTAWRVIDGVSLVLGKRQVGGKGLLWN